MIQAGRLIVNLDAGAVSVDDQPVHLTGKEYGILELLSRHKGTTVRKRCF
jgi:two-component system, cell cycle response regulator CtrA